MTFETISGKAKPVKIRYMCGYIIETITPSIFDPAGMLVDAATIGGFIELRQSCPNCEKIS